ncbi:Blue-light photoreceptor [compost metagenome]
MLRNYRKDGSAFWNELSITPVRNDAEQRTYFIGIQKDVSRQVELERELAEMHARPKSDLRS